MDATKWVLVGMMVWNAGAMWRIWWLERNRKQAAGLMLMAAATIRAMADARAKEEQ